MNEIFRSYFNREPERVEKGISFFDGERDGDCFDESDAEMWRGGRLCRNWHRETLLQNPTSRRMIEAIVERHTAVVELACGPGMGLIPAVKRLAPDLPCMASDANPLVLREWQAYLSAHEIVQNLDFAQFSLFDLPFKSNSVPAFGSWLGISSTRSGETGITQALSEIRRTLAPGGRLYAIENAGYDHESVEKLLAIEPLPYAVWTDADKTAWHDRFTENGLRVVWEAPHHTHIIDADDSDLGRLSHDHGIAVSVTHTAFILEKDT